MDCIVQQFNYSLCIKLFLFTLQIMIDYPVAYGIQKENPSQNDHTIISLSDALSLVLDSNYYTYFRWLHTIQMNIRYELPSGNTFAIGEEWIIFMRAWKKERRLIHAKNKKNARITINSLVYHPDGWEMCVTWKKRWICQKEDGQILRRHEISSIFAAIENAQTYLSPDIDSTGKKKATILEVKYHGTSE